MSGWKRVAVAGMLVAALTVPSVAYAVTTRDGGAGTDAKSAASVAGEALRARRARLALERLRVRFDTAALALGARIVRLERLTSRVESAGADVTEVRALLAKAKSSLKTAKATEGKAVAAFKAIPGATDKKAAFEAAKVLAKQAFEQLKQARDQTREAAAKLKALAEAAGLAKPSAPAASGPATGV